MDDPSVSGAGESALPNPTGTTPDSRTEFPIGDSVDLTGETAKLNDDRPQSEPAPRVTTLEGDQADSQTTDSVPVPSPQTGGHTEQTSDGPPQTGEGGIPSPSHSVDSGGGASGIGFAEIYAYRIAALWSKAVVHHLQLSIAASDPYRTFAKLRRLFLCLELPL